MIKYLIRKLQPKGYIYHCIGNKKIKNWFGFWLLLLALQCITTFLLFSILYLFYTSKNIFIFLLEVSIFSIIITINFIQISMANRLYSKGKEVTKIFKFEVTTEFPSSMLKDTAIIEVIENALINWEDKKTALKLEHIHIKTVLEDEIKESTILKKY